MGKDNPARPIDALDISVWIILTATGSVAIVKIFIEQGVLPALWIIAISAFMLAVPNIEALHTRIQAALGRTFSFLLVSPYRYHRH